MFFSKKERKKERRGGGRKRKKFAQKRRTVTRRVTRLRETERREGEEKKKRSRVISYLPGRCRRCCQRSARRLLSHQWIRETRKEEESGTAGFLCYDALNTVPLSFFSLPLSLFNFLHRENDDEEEQEEEGWMRR